MDDPDIWAQEYLCEFIDTSSVLLPYDLIAPCEVPTLSLSSVPPDAPLYVGMDIGRSKDLSVILVGAKVNGVTHLVRTEILRKMPFAEQLRTLCDIARDPRVRRVAIDATGLGTMLAEEARRALGGKVEPLTFNVKTKGELYAVLRRPITYRAPRTAEGHSDRCTALALALRAADVGAAGSTAFARTSLSTLARGSRGRMRRGRHGED